MGHGYTSWIRDPSWGRGESRYRTWRAQGFCWELRGNQENDSLLSFWFSSEKEKSDLFSFFLFFLYFRLSFVRSFSRFMLTHGFVQRQHGYIFSLSFFSFLFSVIKILRQINYSAILASFVYLFSIFSSGFYPSFPDPTKKICREKFEIEV